MIELREGERLDDLQCKGYRIIQNEKLFCFGVDAVLRSDFARVKEGGRCLDLGTGTGIIPILMVANTKGSYYAGLEISNTSAEMAARCVALNGLEHKVEIIQGDIKEAGELFAPASFDTVTSNPPYMIGQHGLVNPDVEKAAARHEILCTLDVVVKAAARLLKPGGHFYMVHRPFRLAEIICTMSKYKLEPKRMRLVYPYVDKEPNMVLIEGVRGGKPRMTVEPPLIVYEKPGVHTKELLEIYGRE